MTQYAPWWIGGIALASVVVGFWFASGRPLGVSGSWARIVMWRQDKSIRMAEAPFRANPEMLQNALLKATIDHFGREAVSTLIAQQEGAAAQVAAAQPLVALESRSTWTTHATFLVTLVLGGLAATMLRGGVELSFTLGPLHTQLFGTGFGYLMTLFAGGAMVGFGTQLAGGCTSGHGLSGCSRFVSASLIATGVFFGTAVVLSLLLHFFAK